MHYVIVVTQAQVHCLICTHDAQGRARPEGECGHIRQCTSTSVETNMLHFMHSKIFPKLIVNHSAYYIPKDSHCDYVTLILTFL